jgi:hypothetical protein
MLMTLVIMMSYVAIGGGEAQAQGFYDGCPRDLWYQAYYYDGRTIGVGYSAVHIGRPGCPWLIVDITDAQDMAIEFSGKWAYFQPESAAECDGATYTYVVARYEGDILYTTLGSGTVTGIWANWFGSKFCSWRLTEGTRVTSVPSSPYSTYRLLLRAWEADGSERIPAGRFSVGPITLIP